MNSAIRVTIVGMVIGVCAVMAAYAAEDYSQWGDSVKVMLNTTETGAHVGADVYGFPVLVRLDASNFDFSQTDITGKDVRCVKEDRTTLMAYDIELFDKGGQRAAIWARVDTVYGNRDDQYFMLYWNNPLAGDSSAPREVFAGADGFEAVWHLGEQVSDGAAGFTDVTGSSHNGVAHNFGLDADAVLGVNDGIGQCVALGDDSAMIKPNNSATLVPPAELMVSTWFKAVNPVPNDEIVLLGLRKNTGTREFSYRVGFVNGGACFDWVGDGETVVHRLAAGGSITTGTWYHVTAVWANDSVSLYLNGSLRRGPQSTNGAVLAAADWGARMGAENTSGRLHFDGLLDEMRVYDVARNADWIRLEYMNQRPDDSLVTIAPAACVAPAITQHPQNREVPVGGQVALTVVATGTSLSYQWQADTGAGFDTIPSAWNATYTFTAALGDSGSRYRCVVTNECNQATSNPCTVSVTSICDSARVAVHPSDTTVIERSPATLAISATGDGLAYQWLRDGVVVGGATDSTYTFTAQRWDNGVSYRCAVAGVCGADTSDPAVLTVTDTTGPNPLATLTVNALDSSELSIQWTTPESDSTDADSVFVLYSTTSYPNPQSPDGQIAAAMKVVAIGSPQGTRDTSITGLTPGSTYYVSLWLSDTVGNTAHADSVTITMPQSGSPTNPVVVRGTVVDSAHIELRLSNFCDLQTTQGSGLYADYIGVWYQGGSYVSAPDTNAAGWVRFDIAALQNRAGCPGTTHLDTLITVPALSGSDPTYYLSVSVVWRNPDTVMAFVQSNGDEVPMRGEDNPIVLSATAFAPNQVALRWDPIAATGADSIRTFYSPTPIDPGLIDVQAPQQGADVTSTTDTIRGLAPATTYHFASQARINGSWTPTSLNATASATTPEADTSLVPANTIVVDSTWWDSSRNEIGIGWHYSPARPSGVVYGYTVGVDSIAVVSSLPSAPTIDALLDNDTLRIPLGENVLFDTTFTVALRLQKPGSDLWSIVTESSIGKQRTTGISWEPIQYFRSAPNDTVFAFNDHVVMWYDGDWPLQVEKDTLVALRPQTLPDGLVRIGVGFFSRRDLAGPAVRVGLVYDRDSVPDGYSGDDVRLYRLRPDGDWEPFHEYEHDTARSMVVIDQGFADVDSVMLMIDTVPPTVTVLTDTDEPVEKQVTLHDTVEVADNIAGLKIELKYAQGEDAPDTASTFVFDTAAGIVATEVPGAFVTNDNGVRVYLIVSDGRSADTAVLSRQVFREQASDVVAAAKRWVPLRTTAILDDSTLAPVINAITGGGYNNTLCRVFRYFDPNATADSSTGSHQWVEYSAANAPVFELKPGKLMWIKTVESPRLDFGSGVTVSLRDTFEITLPAGQWTDFALPYRFGMRIGDIAAATGAVTDSLELYSWTLSGNRYVTQPFYFGTLPGDSLNRLSDSLSYNAGSGYCVKNPTTHDVTLRLPPTNLQMSSYGALSRRLSKQRDAQDGWTVVASASLSDGAGVTGVVMGYSAGDDGAKPTWYGAAPTFARAGIRVFDSQGGRSYGHVVAHALSGNGVRFTLELYNDLDRPERMTLRLSGTEALPDGWQATLVDGAGGALAGADQGMTVTVPAKQRAYRTVAVGGPGFALTALEHATPFAGFAAFPNPFRGTVTLRYLLPAEAARVEYALYDATGRRIWRKSVSDGIRTGVNVMVWDGRGSRGAALSSGTYLLRADAYDTAGSMLGSREQKLVYVP